MNRISGQFQALALGVFLACGALAAADANDGSTNKLLATDEEKPMPLDASVQNMFYKARSKKTGNMWDVCLAHHNGTYFLFSLCTAGKGHWDNISLAESPDGVH